MKYLQCKIEFQNYIKSYAASSTIYYYNINFQIFEKFLLTFKDNLDFNINELTRHIIIDYITYLRSTKIKNVSIHTYVRAIKSFSNYLFYEGVLMENITHNLKLPKTDKAIKMPINNYENDLLISGINKTLLKERNLLIYYLMLDLGLRLQEVVNLKITDIDIKNHFIKIINSKNNKNRVLPLPDHIILAIKNYMYLPEYTNNSEYLILNNDYFEKATEQSIKIMFHKLKKYVPRIHAHLLRHTFATSYMFGNGDIEILRVLMGHESYNVTKEYVNLSTQMHIINYDIYQLDDILFSFCKRYNLSR